MTGGNVKLELKKINFVANNHSDEIDNEMPPPNTLQCTTDTTTLEAQMQLACS